MIELIDLGISVDNLLEMKEKEPLIDTLSLEEVRDKINLLVELGLNSEDVLGIIESNPHYLVRTIYEIKCLINRLESLEFTNLGDLFVGNPNILNLDVYEIDNYYKKKLNDNISVLDITSELELNEYLFDEM